jgi:hypothetical protein
MEEFTNLVQSHINLLENEYNNPYSGLSPDEEKAYLNKLETGYKQTLDIAKRELELVMSEMLVKEREKFRSLLLRRLYAVSGGNTKMHFNFYDITRDYGINDKEAQEYFQYFAGKDIIRASGDDGGITITGRCITMAEDLIKRSPDEVGITAPAKEQLRYEDQDFSFIADSDLKKIVERDYKELQQLDSSTASKSVLILSGSIIEGLLIDALVTKGDFPSAGDCNKFLKELIYPAKNAGIVKQDNLSDILRVFRNLVHPAREIKDSLIFDESHANHSRAVVGVIISEVRAWYANRPK